GNVAAFLLPRALLRRRRVDQNRVDQPLRREDRIDVTEDGIGAVFAHARRDDDVAAVALDREREGLQLTLAAADRSLALPREQHMRSAGGTAMLTRLKRLVLGEQRLPFIDATDVLFAGINVDAPYARARAGRHGDERVWVCLPPVRDDDRI